jgi:hypothetical protein
VFDGKSLVWPWVEDTRFGKPAVSDLSDALPSGVIFLPAPLERAPPEIDHVIPERRQRAKIGRKRSFPRTLTSLAMTDRTHIDASSRIRLL